MSDTDTDTDTDTEAAPPGRRPDTSSLLEQEIPRQPQVLATAASAFPAPITALLREVRDRDIDDWVVTGCGDGLFAGKCAEVWFARLAERRLRAVPAMELSRENYPSLTPRSVVVAVSHSGTTARVLEAARAARARGAYVVALTGNADSELAAIANCFVDNTVRNERSNCRTASFQAVTLFLRMLAEAVAGRGFSTPPLEALATYLEQARTQVDRLPDAVLVGDHWIFTGSGLGLAVAEYGKAKAHEAATVPAHCVELEQFIHCEIFTVRPETAVVLVAPRGRASSRARELAGGLRKLGAMTIAVTDDDTLAAMCRHAISLPAGLAEDDQPFVEVGPLQWLALRLAALRGDNPDLVNHKWVNRPLIDDSQQWGSEHYEAEPAVPGPAQA